MLREALKLTRSVAALALWTLAGFFLRAAASLYYPDDEEWLDGDQSEAFDRRDKGIWLN